MGSNSFNIRNSFIHSERTRKDVTTYEQNKSGYQLIRIFILMYTVTAIPNEAICQWTTYTVFRSQSNIISLKLNIFLYRTEGFHGSENLHCAFCVMAPCPFIYPETGSSMFSHHLRNCMVP